MLPPNSFLDPTAVGTFPLEYKEGGIRRVLTPLETPEGLAGATEPTAEDLVPIYQDYRIGPGDQLGILIDDLITQGLQDQTLQEVTPSGYIRLHELGSIKVVGLTDQEVEFEIKERLRDSGILPNAVVRVLVQSKRYMRYSILGGINGPGPYPITEPDMRLLDALALARDLTDPRTKRLYVIRREQAERAAGVNPPAEALPPVDDEGLIIPPPTEGSEDRTDSTMLFALASTPERRGAPRLQDPQEREALEAVIAPPSQTTRPTETTAPDEDERRFAPIILDPETGEPVTVRPEQERPGTEEPTQPVVEAPLEQPAFEWEDVPEYELAQRVIEIDVQALMAGDPRYNIVVHERDTIHVPQATGLFYMMGEINRPGVYSLGNQDITLKQAVAMSGGLGVLAWPQRCEIIRKEQGTDKQITIPVNVDAIFAGLQDDLYLRDGDVVNVGTHVVAPFLFVIRNSFRFTYGFGFVYDRNFADQDAYGPKQNPQTRADLQAQRLGLPF